MLNALVGALLPVLRRRSVGPGGSDILVLNPPQDTALFGRPPAEILRDNAVLSTYRELIMDLLSGLWFAFGVFQLAVTWFGLRRGQRWAWWTLVVAGGGQVAGWMAVLRPYLRHGVRLSLDLPPLLLYPLGVLPVAAACAWMGLRRAGSVAVEGADSVR